MTISAMAILSETEILAVSGGEDTVKKKDDNFVATTSSVETPIYGIKILPPPTQDPIRK